MSLGTARLIENDETCRKQGTKTSGFSLADSPEVWPNKHNQLP